MLVGDRLYGLGADLATPHCLLDDITSADIDWGPLADRVRVCDSIYGGFQTRTFSEAVHLEWTAPTGSRPSSLPDPGCG